MPFVSPNRGFGSGVLWATPNTANPTPFRFGVLQDVTLDFKYTQKELYGEYQLPILVARGTQKITGKAKFAAFNGQFMADLFFDVTKVAGQYLVVDNEGPSAIPTTPFQITVVNGASFIQDLGVVNAATGQPFTRVAAAPAAGQYSVNVGTGVYTFASADNVSAIQVLISYRYSTAVAGTFRSILANKLLGDAPVFSLDLYQRNPNSAQQWSLRLYQVISTGLSLALKLEDFLIPDFDFNVYTDGSNNLGEFNLPN